MDKVQFKIDLFIENKKSWFIIEKLVSSHVLLLIVLFQKLYLCGEYDTSIILFIYMLLKLESCYKKYISVEDLI